jgi:hypothetical protein
MKLWGYGWLDIESYSSGISRSELILSARYYPRGLIGYLYWYLSYPVHTIIFKGMARKIIKKAIGK